ncbi:MAG: rhomboid family intramembrane serine protease [Candidatus Thiodiazotropha sp.]
MQRNPVVFGLLGINIVMFLLLRQSPDIWLRAFALWPIHSSANGLLPVASNFRLWQLLSYGFLHGSVMHLLLNMYALWLFGKVLEVQLGSQRFLAFYLACVVGSALFHLLIQQLILMQGSTAHPVIGASGGTFGLLMAFAYLFPDSWLYLLIPPMPVRAKWFVLIYGILELVFGVTGTVNGIAHFAHLGGMLTAYLLVRYWLASPR